MKKSNINFLYIVIIILFLILILRETDLDKDININIIEKKVSEVLDESEEIIKEPKRYYDSRYHPRRAMRINVPTRGEPPAYQQVGILTDTNDPENIKPLYGRQTYRGSNQWNYFTSLDSHLATKIPIYTGDKDCTDERGCQEINKNDMLNIGDPGKQYKANIYQTHAPRYIPYYLNLI
tara:strand:+ start:595 stop:1131 length:537 start_codon:yes stop_codon:yes gene_type:complete